MTAPLSVEMPSTALLGGPDFDFADGDHFVEGAILVHLHRAATGQCVPFPIVPRERVRVVVVSIHGRFRSSAGNSFALGATDSATVGRRVGYCEVIEGVVSVPDTCIGVGRIHRRPGTG